MRLTHLNRRDFLAGVAAASTTVWPSWMPRLAFAPVQQAPKGDTLIVIFLRGAADSLNMVVPFGEDAYYQARPTIGIPQPDNKSALSSSRVVNLDGFFGFHPALAPLLPAWQAGHLGIVHACGAPDDSRSHFKAMELMERGVDDETGPASGWIGRHLATHNTENASPLRAIGLGAMIPRSLYGSVPAAALRSIIDFHLSGNDRVARQMQRMLNEMYSQKSLLDTVGQETLAVLDLLEMLNPADYMPRGNIPYPDSDFGHGLRQIAMLLKAEVGLEVATIDVGGWDTHFAQGGSQGIMASLLSDLGEGLAALHGDLIDHIDQTTVVILSEFGRRVRENASLGTDHGHGGLMMLLGGGIAGNKVHGRWPGLQPATLFGPGDLPVTTDYRDILAEICQNRLLNNSLDEIFPDYAPNFLGVAG